MAIEEIPESAKLSSSSSLLSAYQFCFEITYSVCIDSAMSNTPNPPNQASAPEAPQEDDLANLHGSPSDHSGVPRSRQGSEINAFLANIPTRT